MEMMQSFISYQQQGKERHQCKWYEKVSKKHESASNDVTKQQSSHFRIKDQTQKRTLLTQPLFANTR